MKKLLVLFILIGILTSSALVESPTTASTGGGFVLQVNTTGGTYIQGIDYLKTVLVSQDPSPADPGGYVELLFKIENWGTEDAQNVTFELLPEYPFSLDPGVSAIKELGTIRGLQTGSNAFYVKYKVRVDEDAIDGESEIKVRYPRGSNYITETFDITISDPRTDFEVLAQDSTTLALANTGASTAYSVIVKIPEQKGFRVTGASASIIGNLDTGDYTLATFQIVPITTNVSGVGEKNLIVEISYTDLLGIRRSIQKEVPFEFASSVGTRTQTIQGSQTQVCGHLESAR